MNAEGLFDSLLSRINRRLDGGCGEYSQHADNPVKFVQEVLGDTLTVQLVELLEAVRDYEVVVAMSANGVGKTWAAARAALWFYKTHSGAQVWTAAAPPETNLRRLLWGPPEHGL